MKRGRFLAGVAAGVAVAALPVPVGAPAPYDLTFPGEPILSDAIVPTYVSWFFYALTVMPPNEKGRPC